MLLLRLPYYHEGTTRGREEDCGGVIMASEQAQQLLGQAQLYQQQMQNIVMQKEALKLQVQEIDTAREEVSKSSGPIYKITGPVLLKTTAADAEKEMKEKRELIDLRLRTLEKGEKKVQEKIEEIRTKITQNVSVQDVAE